MINANLDQFLGYMFSSEITLYYKGYTYWCEGWYEEDRIENKFHFFVYRYKSDVYYTKEGEPYTKRHIENGDVVDYSTVFDIYVKNQDETKPLFLSAKIFDGKSFWEVENEIAWYDED
jgi:hypothetical protein